MEGKRLRLRITATLATIALLILAGCGGTPAQTPSQTPSQTPAPTPAPKTTATSTDTGGPVKGGTLTIAYTSTSPHIDIQGTNQGSLSESAHYIFETLFDRNKDGKIVPLLVKEASVSADGLTHTWKLQPNVKFHDGTDFNAEAVKFNIERKISKKLPTWNSVSWDKIEVVDPLTIKITTKAPAFHINSLLASKTWSMYSPTHVQKVGDQGIKSQGVGTGPFTVAEFKPNEVLRLKKNPNYWQKDLPHLDEVVFRVVNDANTRATMLESGDVDIAMGLSAPATERLKGMKDKFAVLEALGARQYYITLNNKKAPTDDKNVRLAINHAVDKQGIIKAVFLGSYARLAEAVYMNSTVDGYAKGGSFEYDPNKAKKILDDAGWKPGSDGVRVKGGTRLTLALHTRKGSVPGDYEIAELVQGMLKQVGIEVQLKVFESAAFVPSVTTTPDKAQYHMGNLTFGTVTGDAEYVMNTAYHTKAHAPVLYNRAYLSNAQIDKLIDESNVAKTKAERDKIYAEVIKLVVAEAPILQLFDSVETVAMSNKVKGVYFEPAFSNWPAKYGWKTK